MHVFDARRMVQFIKMITYYFQCMKQCAFLCDTKLRDDYVPHVPAAQQCKQRQRAAVRWLVAAIKLK